MGELCFEMEQAALNAETGKREIILAEYGATAREIFEQTCLPFEEGIAHG
jgi:hypothetical protein